MWDKIRHQFKAVHISPPLTAPGIAGGFTISDVLSTEERTLPNGNTVTIVKRTTQTELIAPIRDPKTGQVAHTARVVLEPWATDPKKMPEHVKEDLARTFLRSMEEEMRRDPGAKARWDELGKEVLKRMEKK